MHRQLLDFSNKYHEMQMRCYANEMQTHVLVFHAGLCCLGSLVDRSLLRVGVLACVVFCVSSVCF